MSRSFIRTPASMSHCALSVLHQMQVAPISAPPKIVTSIVFTVVKHSTKNAGPRVSPEIYQLPILVKCCPWNRISIRYLIRDTINQIGTSLGRGTVPIYSISIL